MDASLTALGCIVDSGAARRTEDAAALGDVAATANTLRKVRRIR